MNNYSTANKIKILFLGHDYFGGQFLKTILENHSDRIEVVGISTNLIKRRAGLKKNIKKVRGLIKKRKLLSEFKDKILLGTIINKKLLQNPPPVYHDITVAALAQQYSIPVFDASEIYNSNVDLVSKFKVNYTIIASFGKIPETIYKNAPTQFINFHPSLLPKLRGGCPVFTAIVRKIPVTGFSFHLLSEKYDAGPLLYQQEFKIHETDTCREVETAIAQAGANKLHELMMGMEKQNISTLDVSNEKVTYCMKSHEINARLIPHLNSSDEFVQKIKACSSWIVRSAYLRVGIRHFYVGDAEPLSANPKHLKKKIEYHDEALWIKTLDNIAIIKSVYYKKQYYIGPDLLKLNGIMY